MPAPYLHLQPVMTFQEIAAELGISHQYVHQLYQSGLNKIRRRHLSGAREQQSLLDAQTKPEYAVHKPQRRKGRN